MEASTELRVGARKVKVTHLDKVLFPEAGFTKGQVIDYYIRISPFLLPHLKNRPVTLKRFPEGIHGEHFYEKNAPAHIPPWLRTAKVWRASGESQINYVLLNDAPSLVWSANMANIELHTFLARTPKIEQPTMLVFDLDPGPPAGVLECAEVALWLRDMVTRLGLHCFVKSSGSKGLHCALPLNGPVTYAKTQPLAHALAQLLERQHPERVVSDMAKNLREGKVFIDWSQNSNYKTTVCVYSLRAKGEEPFVSMPLEWAEVEQALQARNEAAFFVGPDDAIRRCEKAGDLFAPLLKLKQRLPPDWSRALRASPRPQPKTRPARNDLSLDTYRAKRDFTQTREPAPNPARAKPETAARLFVIQKHQASHLHYDFRLEMGGALKSWAVPKGPPYERNEKRLAMQVEDHPLDYARFEGTIPAGNYGAGTVMVWDIGEYELMDGTIHAGKLHLLLKGKKLKGEWILVQASRDENKRNWFLIKGGTTMKRLSTKRDNSSALTGRSLEQIAHDNDAQWISNRATAATPLTTPSTRRANGSVNHQTAAGRRQRGRRLVSGSARTRPRARAKALRVRRTV
jgi:bifunctional non-homologous end joining protein LigD